MAAKEKPNVGKTAWSRRKAEFTTAEFKSQVDWLTDISAMAQSMLQVVNEMGIESLTVDGATKFARGQKEILGYLEKVEQAILLSRQQHRRDTEKFGPNGDTPVIR
tara:strand:- start:353 stop:670 length:318 start_codon:yes stop_codon:yes gene_type:complete